MAVGALGHGSEFLGFDDELSRDHDWSPAFSVFLSDDDFRDIGQEVFDVVVSLPGDYRGYKPKWGSVPQKSRCGVHTFGSWLKRQCQIDPIPGADAEWLGLHDSQLLWATNGAIWHDPLGEVTATRRRLSYYPESVWLKRLALKCHQLHQYGPYQVARFLKRGDPATVDLTLHFFLLNALKMCFLLRRRYAPVYKWLHAGFLRLPGWSEDTRRDIALLASSASAEGKMLAVSRTLDVFMRELRSLIPSLAGYEEDGEDANVYAGLRLAHAINSAIADPQVRKADLLVGQAGGMDY